MATRRAGSDLLKHNMTVLLTIAGQVDRPQGLTFADLAAIPAEHQVADVSRLVPGRQGDAVKFAGMLRWPAQPGATYLGLHSSTDDFHASIPLAAVAERPWSIYRVTASLCRSRAGGPVRFLIPDFAACHTDEIDECANVKFIDRIELTAEKGFDNRPHDGAEHAALHAKEQRQ